MSTTTLRTPLVWECGFCDDETASPAEYYPAEVPGAVQLDYARAHGWGPFWLEKDPSVYAFMEDKFWCYRAPLSIGGDQEGAVLVFCGIDYRCRIRVDGDTLYEGEGMFSELRLDVSRYRGAPHTLEVRIWPAPKVPPVREGRDEARESCKPPVSYGWDFQPRLIPLGIWDEAYLEQSAETGLLSCRVAPEVADDLGTAWLDAEVSVTRNTRIAFELWDDEGNRCLRRERQTEDCRAGCRLTVVSPHLWWPAGAGPQRLYTLRVLAREECLIEKTVGFRRVRLVMNAGEWDLPDAFPKTRSTPPITLEINGRRLFAKGSNWVNPDVFPGRVNEETYKQLLSLAADANMNILRVWGGGGVNKEPFFHWCDRLGLMVWQEFPLACNEYPDKPAYLQVLEREAVSIVTRLRSHPCVVLWCGGNELFNAWSGMTDQHHALRLLNKVCYELDRRTPFIMTSPLYGMAHGHYRLLDSPTEEFITKLAEQKNTAYTEFGVPGSNSREYLLQFVTQEELDGCRSISDLNRLMPFMAAPIWPKLFEQTMCYYYDQPGTPEQVLERSADLQGMAYKSLFEEMRRQWPRCSMAVNWCLNAPWPLICSENLIDWPCVPKRAFEDVKAALRPQLASLRIRRQVYPAGGEFTAEVWMLNDAFEEMPGDTVEVIGRCGGQEQELLLWTAQPTPPQSNQRGPGVYWRLPDNGADELTVELRCRQHPEWISVYRYRVKSPEAYRRSMTLNNL